MKRRSRTLISILTFLSATALLVFYQWDRHASLSQLANTPPSSFALNSPPLTEDPDAHCVFRHSPLHRSIFVYPSPRDPLFESMKSKRARIAKDGKVPMWRWLELNDQFRESNLLMYDIDHDSENQFATDVYVHDIVTHPKSCLQTNDPEKAKLFYIPHMETLHWRGLELLDQLPDDWKRKRITPYGEALMNAMDGNYTLWEEHYGLTSKYWKRKQGADHFFVMSEPCNGLIHLQGWQRGSHNFIVTQRQHTPPIVISIELSTTYVGMYPKCAAKNIVLPYANVNGKFFRGDFHTKAKAFRKLFAQYNTKGKDEEVDRPILMHFQGGFRGPCAELRRGLSRNYVCDNKSYRKMNRKNIPRHVQMRLSKFCPCPAGDSPSARRMFDAVATGCIPVVLSGDFVWPFTNDVDPSLGLDPSTFSLRLNFSQFGLPAFHDKQCWRIYKNRMTLEDYLEAIPEHEVRRLQNGLRKVAPLFDYYKRRGNLSDTPLSDRLMPDGGAAHFLVQELAKRASGERWEQCKQELALPHPPEPTTNLC